VAPGRRTLTVSVGDEAAADGRFQYTWDVRAPQGPVLFVPDNSSTLAKEFFRELLDTHLGAGNWDTYEFLYGYPDDPANLLETMRLFEAVVWPFGSGTSSSLAAAAVRGGVLEQYVAGGGRLLHASIGVAGTAANLSPVYVKTVLKIDTAIAPQSVLRSFAGLQALGQQSWLPPMTASSNFGSAIGLVPLAGTDTEVIYRMEECCTRGCFGSTNRPPVPCDPAVIVRWPARGNTPLASVVTAGLQPEYFVREEAVAAFTALLRDEMGVNAP
jgi:hypothetical protein